ncbi:MAG: MBOAT family protein [Bacteroidia bacterium]|nr:MBOAT family protein [Bacteroidia bacterium]NNM15622.1 MBOAT family protein [Bacteroidia bacterium]
MLFNSFEFFVFFPLVFIFFFTIPHKYRWALLLAASCVFYMYFVPIYIFILFFNILIDYWAAIKISKTKKEQTRKILLAISIVANLGVLATFKYFNFFVDNTSVLEQLFGWNLNFRYLDLILPIGLSFYTFQSMSYTIEVYRKKQIPEKHFGIFALYVTFFPQLVAGPIERPQNMLHQYKSEKFFDYTRVSSGLKQMLWGFFKKLVIADNLSVMVDAAYANPEEQTGLTLLMATYFFAFQIYCDFSGYTDIAIGAARVLGFKLMDNFNVPYLSSSIKEFWARWHISLSTWFRDYLYIPLGGNRVKLARWQLNLMITFIISGLWHGAAWTFVIWGFLHGMYLVFSIWKDKILSKLIPSLTDTKSIILKGINTLIVFHLALFAWIFFRANDVNDAFTIIHNITSINLGSEISNSLSALSSGQTGRTFFKILLLALFIIIDPLMDSITKNKIIISNSILKWLVYSAIAASIVLFGYFGEVEFIYFQF